MSVKKYFAAVVSASILAGGAMVSTAPAVSSLTPPTWEGCIEESAGGELTYFADQHSGLTILEVDGSNLDLDSARLVSTDGEDISGLDFRIWEINQPTPFRILVSNDVEAGKTWNLAIEANTITGESFRSDIFQLAVPGIGDVSGKPGERVEVAISGFPGGTEFALTDEARAEGWKLERGESGALYITIPDNIAARESYSVEILTSYSCVPRPNNIGKDSGSGSFTLKVTVEGEGGSSEDFDKSKLWWLLTIPVGGLLIWGINQVLQQVPGVGSSIGDEPKVPTPVKPDEPKDTDKPEDGDKPEDTETEVVTEQGTPSAPDAPRKQITSVPSGATKLEAGVASYI